MTPLAAEFRRSSSTSSADSAVAMQTKEPGECRALFCLRETFSFGRHRRTGKRLVARSVRVVTIANAQDVPVDLAACGGIRFAGAALLIATHRRHYTLRPWQRRENIGNTVRLTDPQIQSLRLIVLLKNNINSNPFHYCKLSDTTTAQASDMTRFLSIKSIKKNSKASLDVLPRYVNIFGRGEP